jgi:hypothetical protein
MDRVMFARVGFLLLGQGLEWAEVEECSRRRNRSTIGEKNVMRQLLLLL